MYYYLESWCLNDVHVTNTPLTCHVAIKPLVFPLCVIKNPDRCVCGTMQRPYYSSFRLYSTNTWLFSVTREKSFSPHRRRVGIISFCCDNNGPRKILISSRLSQFSISMNYILNSWYSWWNSWYNRYNMHLWIHDLNQKCSIWQHLKHPRTF